MAGAEGEPRKGVTRQATRENDGVANPPPPVAMVTFPDAARRRAQNFPPPLKLECEDSTEDMNPRNLWQVYALGGFMISNLNIVKHVCNQAITNPKEPGICCSTDQRDQCGSLERCVDRRDWGGPG
ncbi:hypothetical protein OPV22_020626 [Ensete ventricosum]|uniref:Uncharacterized protein n=1 Tax=Ensete ventricosum TaxID=4639 RepID=A0AAV8QAX1_ENSVE|nr:hypothetical protein OPV22_020626 [Ensete ventricosum]